VSFHEFESDSIMHNSSFPEQDHTFCFFQQTIVHGIPSSDGSLVLLASRCHFPHIGPSPCTWQRPLRLQDQPFCRNSAFFLLQVVHRLGRTLILCRSSLCIEFLEERKSKYIVIRHTNSLPCQREMLLVLIKVIRCKDWNGRAVYGIL